MNLVLFHLGLASAGLLALALMAAITLLRWRSRPGASYRLVRGIVIGALVLGAGQVALERSGTAPWVRATLSKARSASAEPRAAEPVLDQDTRGESYLAAPSDLAQRPTASMAGPDDHPSPSTRPSWNTDAWAPGIFWAWLAGCVFFLWRTLRGIRGARRLLMGSEPLVDAELLRAWREATRECPRAQGVELRASGELELPACYGFVRRAVLLPRHARRVLEPACLRQVLLHELIHLERRDTWTMCAAELLRALLWFHPAAWWLCREVDELRELSCDAEVIARAGRPRTYARGLVACAERIQPHALNATLPSWSGSKSQFSRRIEMLLQSRAQTVSISRGAKLLLGACFALCAGAQLALASVAPQEASVRALAAPVPRAVHEESTPALPETERRLHALGYAQPHRAPTAAPQVESGEALAQASELVRRALARNPGDEDLRRAIELLEQARALREYAYARPDGHGQSHAWGHSTDAGPTAPVAEERAARLRDLIGLAEQDDEEAARRMEQRAREYHVHTGVGAFAGALERTPPRVEGSGSLEEELQETLRILEQQRTELERLRERIESLRSQARAENPLSPAIAPRGAR